MLQLIVAKEGWYDNGLDGFGAAADACDCDANVGDALICASSILTLGGGCCNSETMITKQF